MTIQVAAEDVDVSRPIQLTMSDSSGAHVILTVSIENRPPLTHVFDSERGELMVSLDLPAGTFHCAFTVQAFRSELNGMVSSAIAFNKKSTGRAKGSIDDGATFDVGFDDFTLTVQ
jgi:hypothetical protein